LKDERSYIAAAELYRKCRKEGHTIRSTVDFLVTIQLPLEPKISCADRIT
jgi:hypothetical protein